MTTATRIEPEEVDAWYFEATMRDLARKLEDPSLVEHVSDLVRLENVKRVLDVGCGIGQALFALAALRNAMGVGVDISELACRMGREFYAERLPEARVHFVRSPAEYLPFASASFDVVNCGLALPYTDNASAIAEISRVLRPGGLFLLKIHHARYYAHQLRAALAARNPSSALHAGRVLASGAIYHSLRRQPRARLLRETFQTEWMLRRELGKRGLMIEREQPNSNPLTPAYVIRKES